MRSLFGVLSLLVVVAIIGLLARKQLSTASAMPAAAMPAVTSTPGIAGPTVREQSQQMQQQYRQAVEGALQAPRAMPDDNP